MNHENDTRPLVGKVALVTGGARGIGEAIAQQLANAGAKVAITAQSDMGAAEATAARITESGASCMAVRMDLTDRRSVAGALSEVVALWGRLDLLVNNAGTSAPGRLLDLTTEDWDRSFDIHAKGFFYVGTEAARHMATQGSGAIIAIAGASALRCYPGNGSYGPSKSAVLATMRQMAVEWAPLGIRVNAVCPGPVRDPASDWQTKEPALASEVARLPLPRAGTPDEIADAVRYLALAGYVTGQELVVDGGGTTTWYIQG